MSETDKPFSERKFLLNAMENQTASTCRDLHEITAALEDAFLRQFDGKSTDAEYSLGIVHSYLQKITEKIGAIDKIQMKIKMLELTQPCEKKT